jgi:hypothetical protein
MRFTAVFVAVAALVAGVVAAPAPEPVPVPGGWCKRYLAEFVFFSPLHRRSERADTSFRSGTWVEGRGCGTNLCC